ncbi:MAG: hypothetical protein IJN29_09915 [Akkermansia sp.]|nr:hypothetical protein [Akkermansia sp.]
MAFDLKNLTKNPPVWFRQSGTEEDVIIGVMGRLVRNLPGHAFPGWSTAEGRKKVADILVPAILSQPGFRNAYHAEMTELSYGCRRALLERRQISPCMAARQDGCHLIINRKQDLVVMVNEEEHLTIHGYAPGLDFRTLLSQLHRLPERLSRDLHFACNSRFGYLSSLPGEAGDGVQLYVILHLPALTVSNMMPQVNRSVEKLQLNTAPFFPQLGEECGNTYVLYTNPAPYGGMATMLEHLIDVSATLTTRELQVRHRLMELPTKGDHFLADRINRSYGLLRYALSLSGAEWVNALSLLRLGVNFSYIVSDDAEPEELLAELAALTITGGDFAEGQDPEPRLHPRASTAAERARCKTIRHFLNHTSLTTAPGA